MILLITIAVNQTWLKGGFPNLPRIENLTKKTSQTKSHNIVNPQVMASYVISTTFRFSGAETGFKDNLN